MAVEFKKVLQKHLVTSEDMPSEMAQEATEIITSGIDKFISTDNFEKAAQNIKESLDKKFGPTWHVCVGEGFGFDITYNLRNMIYVYYGEKLGILVFKM